MKLFFSSFSYLSMFFFVLILFPAAPTTAVPAAATTAVPAAPTTDPATAAYCAVDPTHTMCIYPAPSESCAKKTKYRGLSQTTKDLIVEKHNKYRSKVALGQQEGQPPAAGMNKLVWNEELATIAQRLTDQCKYEHANSSKLDKTSVGQNLGRSSSSRWLNEENYQADAVGSIDRWYNEVKLFKSSWIDPFHYDKASGHYTQVVWAKTTEVGCGLTYYDEEGTGKNLFACNYAEAGNVRPDQYVYKIGEACSQCAPGTSCSDDGLCVSTK